MDVADLLKGAADPDYRQGVLQQSGQVSQPALHTAVGVASQLPCKLVAVSTALFAKLVCAGLSLGAPETAEAAGQRY